MDIIKIALGMVENTAAPADVKPLVKMNLDKLMENVDPPSDPSAKAPFYRELQKKAEEGLGIFDKTVLEFIHNIPDSYLPKDGRKFFVKWVANGFKEDGDIDNDDVLNTMNYWEILGRTEEVLKESFGTVSRAVSKFREFFEFIRSKPSNMLPDEGRDDFLLWLGDQFIGGQNVDEERIRFIRDFFIGNRHNAKLLDGDFEAVFDKAETWHESIVKSKVKATKYLADINKTTVYSGHGYIIAELSTKIPPFALSNDLSFEGSNMRNCIGTIHKKYVMDGSEVIYSLRDPSPPHKPRVSISYADNNFSEAKEFANRQLIDPKYAIPVYDFLSSNFPYKSWDKLENSAWSRIPEVSEMLKEKLGEDKFSDLLFASAPSYEQYAKDLAVGKNRDLNDLDWRTTLSFYNSIPTNEVPGLVVKFPDLFLRLFHSMNTDAQTVKTVFKNIDPNTIQNANIKAIYNDVMKLINTRISVNMSESPLRGRGHLPGWWLSESIDVLGEDITKWPSWFFHEVVRNHELSDRSTKIVEKNFDKVLELGADEAAIILSNEGIASKFNLEDIPPHIVDSKQFSSDAYVKYVTSIPYDDVDKSKLSFICRNLYRFDGDWFWDAPVGFLVKLDEVSKREHYSKFGGDVANMLMRRVKTSADVVHIFNSGIYEMLGKHTANQEEFFLRIAKILKKSDVKKITNLPEDVKNLMDIKFADSGKVEKYIGYLKGFRSPKDFQQAFIMNPFLNYMVRKMPVDLIPMYIRKNLDNYGVLTSILPRSEDTANSYINSDHVSTRALAARCCSLKYLPKLMGDRSYRVRKAVASRINPKYLPQMANDRDARVQEVVLSRMNGTRVSSEFYIAIDMIR